MRMIGIGLMGFLLAGIALLLSTMNILEKGQRYVREITTGPQLVFEHRTAAPAQDAHTAQVTRANIDHPVILSGFPAYQSVTFIMPVDARPTSGYLQIDATSQVLDGVEGVLRITIHNTRRGEMLLRSGEVGRSLQIPLSPTDFSGNQLVVSFSLQGTSPQATCGPEDGVEAVVEIETTSAVFLTLDRPLESTRDRVHAWGNTVNVAWPQWLDAEEQLRRLVLAAEFRRRGMATRFDASADVSGLTTTDLRAALPLFPTLETETAPPHRLAQTGTNAGLRRFYRQGVWRLRYALGTAPDQIMPNELELNMHLGRLIGDDFWNVTVALNNRLVFQTHINGAQRIFQAGIILPTDIQTAANTLEIVTTSTAKRHGICDHGPELVAEMLPTSKLVYGDSQFANALSEVTEALRTVGPVNIDMAGPMSALSAGIAGAMLDQVIPSDIAIKPAATRSHVTLLHHDDDLPALPANGPAWLITQGSAVPELAVQKLLPGEIAARNGMALLITPGALVSRGTGG